MKKRFYFFFLLFFILCTSMYAHVGIGIDSINVSKKEIIQKPKIYVSSGTTLTLDPETEKQVEIVKLKDSRKEEESKKEHISKLVKLPKKQQESKKLTEHLQDNIVRVLVVKSIYSTKPISIKGESFIDNPIVCQSFNCHYTHGVLPYKKAKIGYFFIVKKNQRLRSITERILNNSINTSIFSRPPPFLV